MIDGINAEKSSTESTAKSFDNIQNNTYAIRDNVEQLTQSIVELKNANNVIVDSIQTISAVFKNSFQHMLLKLLIMKKRMSKSLKVLQIKCMVSLIPSKETTLHLYNIQHKKHLAVLKSVRCFLLILIYLTSVSHSIH